MPKLTAVARKADILEHACKLARRVGYAHLTRAQVATAAGISDGLVSRHWGTMAQLRRAIMRHAVSRRYADIVAQGLCACPVDRHALAAPPDLRAEAARTVAMAGG